MSVFFLSGNSQTYYILKKSFIGLTSDFALFPDLTCSATTLLTSNGTRKWTAWPPRLDVWAWACPQVMAAALITTATAGRPLRARRSQPRTAESPLPATTTTTLATAATTQNLRPQDPCQSTDDAHRTSRFSAERPRKVSDSETTDEAPTFPSTDPIPETGRHLRNAIAQSCNREDFPRPDCAGPRPRTLSLTKTHLAWWSEWESGWTEQSQVRFEIIITVVVIVVAVVVIVIAVVVAVVFIQFSSESFVVT